MHSTTTLLEQLIECGTPAHLVAAVKELENKLVCLDAELAVLYGESGTERAFIGQAMVDERRRGRLS